MPPDGDTDIQVARYWNLTIFKSPFVWRGQVVELGGRGRLVQLWAIHHYMLNLGVTIGAQVTWASALSSNPNHEGDLGLVVVDFLGDAALYGTSLRNEIDSGTSISRDVVTQIVPLYGLIRPRRQIWVLCLEDLLGNRGFGIEIYYSEIPMPRQDVITANRKYGKHRRS